MDFTLDKYEALCQAIRRSGYTTLGFSDYIQISPSEIPEHVVLLRHDVDRRPAHSIDMAQMESDYGITATYFHRTLPRLFSPDIISQTASLGHEIGYHYETLVLAKGNIKKAINLFDEHLALLRDLVPVTFAAMHGSPFTRYDNRLIWQSVSPKEFGLLGETYRDIDYKRVVYLNDTGRTWHPTRYNIRDHTTEKVKFQVETTDDIIALVESRRVKELCLSTHPERWDTFGARWVIQFGKDLTINTIKTIILYSNKLKTKRSY